MRMHKRLIETEGSFEASLQGRQEGLISQPTQISLPLGTAPPMVTTSVPLTDTTTTTTTSAPASTSTTILAVPTIATGQEANLSMEEMMKEIKTLELQRKNLKEAKEKLAKIEEKYDRSKMDVAEKARTIKILEKRIKELEKDLTLNKTLAEIKRILWAKIGQSITDQWPSIQTIYEQLELINITQFEV